MNVLSFNFDKGSLSFPFFIIYVLLFRILKLNATPLGVGFCSQKGDLLVGIGTNVHFIDYRMCEYNFY